MRTCKYGYCEKPAQHMVTLIKASNDAVVHRSMCTQHKTAMQMQGKAQSVRPLTRKEKGD